MRTFGMRIAATEWLQESDRGIVSVLAHMRKALLPVAIVVAIVVVALPIYRMVGCDMDMNAMRIVPMHGSWLSAPCPGTWEVSSAPASTLPSGGDSLLLVFVAALAAMVLMLAPQVVSLPVLMRVSDPPPPPEEPLGARFRV